MSVETVMAVATGAVKIILWEPRNDIWVNTVFGISLRV